jgi:putative phosphoesterase
VIVAVIADTHLPRGRRRLPSACLEAIAASELLLHAGDIATASALEELRSLGPPVEAVCGNADDAKLRRALPARLELTVGHVKLGVIHDAGPARGRLARMRELFPAADAVVFGHTHAPTLLGDSGFQVFNPGSPTERRRAPHRSMGIAEVNGGRIAFQHIALA